MDNTIFIAIASYLDYEVRHTILDCIRNAKYPENLHFSVCLQYDDNSKTGQNCIDDLKDFYNIQISKYPYTESKGGCWARQIAQSNYNGEKYSMQVDSHTRFGKDWDETLIKDYEALASTGIKPLLSFLPPPYHRDDETGVDHSYRHFDNLDRMNIPKIANISTEYWPNYGGYENEINIGFQPKSIILLYGGFIFADGKWVVDVEQDPEHYYTGEEFALAIRSYTHGYDMYTPSQIVAWHRTHNAVPKKHYNTAPTEEASQRHRTAIERLRMLIEGGDLGKYGLGSKRTLEQYGEYAGIDFKNKRLTDV